MAFLINIKRLFTRLLKKGINSIISKDPNGLVFIPHGGCYKDGYSVINYKSDNALALLNYISKYYGTYYKYSVAVGYNELEITQKRFAIFKSKYPDIDIECFPYFFDKSVNKWIIRKMEILNHFHIFFRGSYFFTSESIDFSFKLRCQTIIGLGYYIPFKKCHTISFHGLFSEKRLNISYDFYITSCMLSSQILSHAYELLLNKFEYLGFSRNDELFNFETNEQLELFINNSVDYPVHKIFLYTPTHRDYEYHTPDHTSMREILGFPIEKEKLASILREYSAVIICKLHSKQNIEVLKKELPKGILLHKPNSQYGLCELMQYSDYLITDYSSTYFDYLLLDKPVLFNFYDYPKYESDRGFSYDPLYSIIAGEVFNDKSSFFEKILMVLNGIDECQQKRLFVRNLFHKFSDNKASERICNLVLKTR